MKSLTEKIINEVYEFAADLEGNQKQQLETLAAKLEKMEGEAEFEEVARVMMKHLGTQVEKYHPHHSVITTSTTCELVEGCKSCGQITDYIKD